jgi:CheY-like chemotaxis protein
MPWVYAAPGTTVRALVVDDIEVNLTVAQGYLNSHNIEADAALSGKEALEKVTWTAYDIIFMDHMMPDMDGIEAAARLRAFNNCKTTPIIALTANAVSGARDFFLQNGFNDFISKPIQSGELNRQLYRWLPTEKVILGKNPKRKGIHVSSPEETRAREALTRIEGLESSEGLKYAGGNFAEYAKNLLWLCDNFHNEEVIIRDAAAQKNWTLFRIKTHALKGILATLGADGLSAWARELENCAKNGLCDGLDALADAFFTAASTFRSQINEISELRMLAKNAEEAESGDKKSKQTAPEAAGAVIPAADWLSLASKLADACEAGKAQDVDTLTAELKNADIPKESIKEINDAFNSINDYEYDSAAVSLKKLVEDYKT